MPTKTKSTAIRVLIAANGHALIYPGIYHQGLIVHRERLPEFVIHPHRVPLLIIPPFGAAVLDACLAETPIVAVKIACGQAEAAFNVTFHLDDDVRIRFYSDSTDVPKASELVAEGITR